MRTSAHKQAGIGGFLVFLIQTFRGLDWFVTVVTMPTSLGSIWRSAMSDLSPLDAALTALAAAFLLWGCWPWLAGRFPRRDNRMEPVPMSQNRSINTTGQSGGFNNTGDNLTVNFEDRSLKRRLRDVLAAVDQRIPGMLDAGQMRIVTRMADHQFRRFADLCAEHGSAELIAKAERGPDISGTTISNGSLGPTTPEAIQMEVEITFKPAIRQ